MPQLLSEQFLQLDLLLSQYQQFWRFSPFHLTSLPWADTKLGQHLQQLEPAETEKLDQDEVYRRSYFSEFFPELNQFSPFHLTQQKAREQTAVPFWFSRDIKGRKLEQIQTFALQMQQSDLPVLEWCAGKGHLGRWLSFSMQRKVTSLEWQPQLCSEGQQQAEKLKLSQGFVQADVLSEDAAKHLNTDQQIVALHACGDLHIRLLQLASQAGTEQLDIVPCCYHLIATEQYQAVSTLAQQSRLGQLSRDELKLAVQAQVTAGERVTRLRQTEVFWRLAYQELYQALQKVTDYRPLSSVPKHWFSGEFSAFAQWAAGQHQWQIPVDTNWDYYLQLGQQRHILVQKMQLVRSLFRPLLEQWLVLDRALFLQQQGYQVQVKQFCDYQLTPRNLMISACKAHG
ncbi:methyltransferase [Rheinheimera soli]|uniref:methyltransferase n=1 Tax=Rheinheimera soli TaxID=443616 RepID=UPI001E33873A|nr:methyltransferase [Rheinheimera soli]